MIQSHFLFTHLHIIKKFLIFIIGILSLCESQNLKRNPSITLYDFEIINCILLRK